MNEEILTLAKCVTGAPKEDWAYLETLCRAEGDALRARLIAPLEGREGAFACAAAWLAAADYFCSRAKALTGAASWSAGDVSVKEADGAERSAAAEALRSAARQLMEGCLRDDSFAFRGVRG